MIKDIYILHYLLIVSIKSLFCLHLLSFILLIQVISLSLENYISSITKQIKKTSEETSFN